MNRRAQRRFDRDLAEYHREARARGRDTVNVQRALGDVATARQLVECNPPPRSFSRVITYGLLTGSMVALALAYTASASRLGTFSGGEGDTHSHSLQSALRQLRVEKGFEKRSLAAQLLEPLYFIRVRKAEDIRASSSLHPDTVGDMVARVTSDANCC